MEGEAPRPQPKESLSPEISVGSYSIASERHPQRNEDSVFVLDNNRGFGVLDGIGGHFGGDRASSLAAGVIKEGFERLGDASSLTAEVVGENVRRIMVQANTAVIDENARLGARDRERMGTTACVVYIWQGSKGERKAIIGNVGDSRGYVIDKAGTVKAVTLDDNLSKPTVPTEQLDEAAKRRLYAQQRKFSEASDFSALSRQDQDLLRQRNVITQSLGIQERVSPSIYVVDLSKDDRIVVVSDGVSDNLTDSEMIRVLKSQQGSSAAATRLVNEALSRSRDNRHNRSKPDDMSAVVVNIGESLSNTGQIPVISQIPSRAVGEGQRRSEPTVSTARNVYELFQAVDRHGSFQGSSRAYDTEYLKEVIAEVMSGEKALEHVTRTDGLRDAVARILQRGTAASQERYLGSIAQAQSMDQLFQALGRMGKIQGSSSVYTSERLQELIADVMAGKKDLQYITRSEGLRDKVEELMRKQRQSGLKGIANKIRGK